MKHHPINKIAAALVLTLCMSSWAYADSKHVSAPPLAQYDQECTGCHIAYPPGMLPRDSWQRIMDNLSKHYGTDASLDAPDAQRIGAWLQEHANTYKANRELQAPPQDRITKSAWFLKEHKPREIPPAVWRRPSVGSASNCAACHTNADKGSFKEREIMIPR